MQVKKVSGCPAWLSALVVSAGVLGLCGASFGQVTGTVKLQGKPPKRQPVVGMNAVPDCAKQHKDPVLDETVVADEDGNLANVVVYLKGAGIKPQVPSQPAVLDQKGCQYVPHVVAMMVGQKLEAKNDDPFLHNVHTLPEDNEPTNIAQVNKGEDKLKDVKAVETFPVKCDVHPWMKAWVVALDNQYFAVSDDSGAYSIDTKGLPDGTYELHAWQEKYKEAPVAKVTIKGGKAEANITFKTAKANADGVKVIEQGAPVKLTSLTSGAAAERCPACGEAAKKAAKESKPAKPTAKPTVAAAK